MPSCPPGYRHNGFVATHALGHMMYGYTFLNKQSKERNIGGHKWSTTYRVLISHRSKMGVIYMQSWKQYICDIFTYITLLALLVEHSLFRWYQHCVTVDHVTKCMSCHKTIVVITGMARCFHDCIYIRPILLLWDLSTLCVVDHLWPLILSSLLCLLSTVWFIGTSNELPQSHCGDNREGTLFSWLHIY